MEEEAMEEEEEQQQQHQEETRKVKRLSARWHWQRKRRQRETRTHNGTQYRTMRRNGAHAPERARTHERSL